MFIKNVATLMTGGVVANIISVISIPIVSRLFDPEDFGSLTLFFSIISVVMIVLTLRYEHAIVLPDNEPEAMDLFLLSIYLLLVFTAVILIFVLSLYFISPDFSWVKALGFWFLMLPLGAFLISLGNIAVSYNTRLKKYNHIAVSDVSQVGVVSGTRIGLGSLFGSSPDFLILGQLLGSLSRIYVLLKHLHLKLSYKKLLLKQERAVYLLKKYVQFPLYSMPTGLLRSGAQALPVFILAFMFTPAIVGLYGMAIRLANIPVSLMGESIRRAYLQKAAVMTNEKSNLTQSLTKLTFGLGLLGFFIYFPLYLWGGIIFEILLGEKWIEAGVYVSILSPWFFVLFLQSAAAVIFVVQKKQEVLLKIQILSMILMLIFFLVSHINQLSAEHLLIGISSIGVAVNAFIILNAYRLTTMS